MALTQHAAKIVTRPHQFYRFRRFCRASDPATLSCAQWGLGMNKIMLAGVGVALMAIPSANAADLGRPAYKAPPPTVPAFSWTGCYIGGNIGGGWGRETASAPTLAPGISVTGDTSGVIGGGQVGCN